MTNEVALEILVSLACCTDIDLSCDDCPRYNRAEPCTGLLAYPNLVPEAVETAKKLIRKFENAP